MHTVFKHFFSYLNVFKLFLIFLGCQLFHCMYVPFFFFCMYLLKKDKPYILHKRDGLSSEFATNLEITNLHVSNLLVNYSVSAL